MTIYFTEHLPLVSQKDVSYIKQISLLLISNKNDNFSQIYQSAKPFHRNYLTKNENFVT